MKFNWFNFNRKEALERNQVQVHEEQKFLKGKRTNETAKILAEDCALMGVL